MVNYSGGAPALNNPAKEIQQQWKETEEENDSDTVRICTLFSVHCPGAQFYCVMFFSRFKSLPFYFYKSASCVLFHLI